jgi:hypothetical protein
MMSVSLTLSKVKVKKLWVWRGFIILCKTALVNFLLQLKRYQNHTDGDLSSWLIPGLKHFILLAL